MSAHIRARLTSLRPPDSAQGWFYSLAVFGVALLLRFNRLKYPNKIIFDETYYANDAWSLLHHGVETSPGGTTGSFIVHPPVGKWMIAMGEAMFGYNSFGWRFSAALCGSLCVLILCRVVRRITGSTFLGCVAGMLMSLDGLEYVMSRTGLLDIFLLFWIMVSLACLVLDRDNGRARLLARLDDGASTDWPGPALGFRWWRLAGGISMGLAVATKWSALYYMVAFMVLTAVWDVGARRSAGIARPFRAAMRRDWIPIPVIWLVVPGIVYVASWTGWFVTGIGWDRHYKGRHNFIGTIQNWVYYNRQIWDFHKSLSTPHPYASQPYTWLVLGKPVSFSADYPTTGQKLYGQTCHAQGKCYSEVLALGTPAIWWAGLGCMFVVAGLWISKRDWRASLVLVGFAAGFLPWLPFPHRTMFFFYALPLFPFEVIAITLTIGLILGMEKRQPDGSIVMTVSEDRRTWALLGVGAYLMLVIINFMWLHPIFTGDLISPNAWAERVSDWFPGWV